MKKLFLLTSIILLASCGTTYDCTQPYQEGEQVYMDKTNKTFVVKRNNKYHYVEIDDNGNYVVGGEIKDAYYLSKVHGLKITLPKGQ